MIYDRKHIFEEITIPKFRGGGFRGWWFVAVLTE